MSYGHTVVMAVKVGFILAWLIAIPFGIAHALYFTAVWDGGANSPSPTQMAEIHDHAAVRYVTPNRKQKLELLATVGISATVVLLGSGASLFVLKKHTALLPTGKQRPSGADSPDLPA